jgi:uncharacterized membrane protein YphA (DoxX/SURF4 family)
MAFKGHIPSTEAPMIDTRTAPYAALLLRVSLGVLFLAHGLLLKVLTFTIQERPDISRASAIPAGSPIS